MDNKDFENLPRLKDIRAKNEVHGKLMECAWSTSSSGMMYNSNSLHRIDIKNNTRVETIVTVTKKPPFGETETNVYKVDRDLLAEITKIVERENLAAWSELRYIDNFQIMDSSSSEHLELSFDDTSVGGYICVSRMIDAKAARQQGGGDVIDEIRQTITDSLGDKHITGSSTVGQSLGPMAQQMQMLIANNNGDPLGDGWICSKCRTMQFNGKFCSECGAPRE